MALTALQHGGNLMKNIFLTILLVLGTSAFMACTQPNGGDSFIDDTPPIDNPNNGGNGGGEGGNGEEGNVGDEEIVLSDENIDDFTFFVKTEGFGNNHDGESQLTLQNNTNSADGWNNFTYLSYINHINGTFICFSITNGEITYRHNINNATTTWNINGDKVVFTITKN